MTFSSQPKSVVIKPANNLSPYMADVPDSSIEVKVTLIIPSGGGLIAGSSSLEGNTTVNTPPSFEPYDLVKFSRINVTVTIENATNQNLNALMDSIKNEVLTKASSLCNMPEAV
jgi:hypothetical protein